MRSRKSKTKFAIGIAGLSIVGLLIGINSLDQQSRAMKEWYKTGDVYDSQEMPLVNVMAFGYNGPLSGLPSGKPPLERAGQAVVMSLAGCGFGRDGGDGLPWNTVILSVGEKLPNGNWKDIDACRRRDGRALSLIYQRQLSILLNATKSRSWFRGRKIILRGYGEAVPTVAAFSGKNISRIGLGEPCVAPWHGVALTSPMTLLLTTPSLGVVDSGENCKALDRPYQLKFVKQYIAKGRLTVVTMPAPLAQAKVAVQRAAVEQAEPR